MAKPNKNKNQQQRRPANLPARFAFRQKKDSEATKNGAGATQSKTNKTNGDCLKTREGKTHSVCEMCTSELRLC